MSDRRRTLTPVKVRGKKSKAKAEPSALRRPLRISQITSTSETSLKTRAILTNPSWPSVSPAAQSKRKRRRGGTTLSLLEQLPTELLQEIFLYSMNADLALTTRVLAARLSSEYMFVSFALRAIFTPCMPDAVDAAVQSRTLRARFFTWDLFCKCFVAALEKRRYLQETNRMRGIENAEGKDDDSSESWMPKIVQFKDKVYMPTKLLSGPWWWDKLHLLKTLCIWGLRADRDNSTAVEVATRGLWTAIEEDNEDVISLLTSSAIGARVSSEMLSFYQIKFSAPLSMRRIYFFD